MVHMQISQYFHCMHWTSGLSSSSIRFHADICLFHPLLASYMYKSTRCLGRTLSPQVRIQVTDYVTQTSTSENIQQEISSPLAVYQTLQWNSHIIRVAFERLLHVVVLRMWDVYNYKWTWYTPTQLILTTPFRESVNDACPTTKTTPTQTTQAPFTLKVWLY